MITVRKRQSTKIPVFLFFAALCMFVFMISSAEASEQFTTDGKWITDSPGWYQSEEGGITISYCGTSSVVTVPRYVQTEAGGEVYTVRRVILGGKETIRVGSGENERVIDLTQYPISEVRFELGDDLSTTVHTVYGPTVRPNQITSISFPQGVTTINYFGYGKQLQTVVLPETVTTLTYSAFNECSALKNINLEHVQNFDAYSLRGTAIESLPLGDTAVQVIGYSAFENCLQLTDVSLPATLKSIDHNAFKGCEKMKNCTFAEGCGLETIGKFAFENCTALESMILPDTVVTISDSAFLNCSSLKTLHLSSHLTYLGGRALHDCSSLEELTLPASLTSYGNSDVHDLSGLKKLVMEDGIGLDSIPFTLPSLEELYAPINVNSGVYTEFPCLRIAVVSNMRYLGKAQNTLEELTILDPNTSISLSNYSALRKATLPDDMKAIPDSAFSGCVSLAEVNFPSALETIGVNAFKNCAIMEADIPDGVTVIDYAFVGCTSLWKVRMHGGIYSIRNAFQGCTSLVEVEMPFTDDGETELFMANAFQGCTSLTEIWIPPQVKNLNHAFSGCISLNDVMISDLQSDNWKISDTQYAFEDCISLREIYLPEGRIASYGFRMFKNSGLEEIEIPEGITRIEAEAFQGCGNLRRVILPQTLLVIGSYAFADCPSLQRLDVPDSVGEFPYSAVENDTIELITSQDKPAWSVAMQSAEDGITHSFRNPLRFIAESDVGFETDGNRITVYAPEVDQEGSFYYRYILVPGYDENGEGAMTAQGTGKRSASFTVQDTNAAYTAKVIVGRTSMCVDTASVGTGCDGDERIAFWNPVNAYVDENGEIQFISGYSQLAYLPTALERIEEGAFDTASFAGRMIVLHNGVNEIGARAFADTGIAAIFIPESVTSIGAGAFDGCSFTIFCVEGSWAAGWSDGFEHVVTLTRNE